MSGEDRAGAEDEGDGVLCVRGRWWVLFAVGVSSFMTALDASVVNTVLPVLRLDLHASVAGIEWVITMYLLVVSALLLGVGRAGDLHGHKRIFVAGFFLFVLGSALCGMAPTVGALVGLRALQAVGATMLFANAPAILTRSFPATQRGRALGALATMTYLGLTVGPSMGGWLAGALGWRAIFYINVPIGALAIVLGLRVIPDDRPEATSERFDFAGSLLFTGGLVALLVALNQGHAWGWGSLRMAALLALALLLLIIFVNVEGRRSNPMLDLSLFRSRLFSMATISGVLNYSCMFCALFVLPFLLIQGRGLSAQQAGLILTVQPLVMAIVAPISGTLSDRIGSRIPTTAAMLILTVGLVVIAREAASASLTVIAVTLGCVGLGVGMFGSANNSAIMGAAPRHRQGIASGVLATARNVGMVLGVGLAGAVFTTILAGAAAGSHDALIHGVEMSLYVAAGIGAVGAVTSALR